MVKSFTENHFHPAAGPPESIKSKTISKHVDSIVWDPDERSAKYR